VGISTKYPNGKEGLDMLQKYMILELMEINESYEGTVKEKMVKEWLGRFDRDYLIATEGRVNEMVNQLDAYLRPDGNPFK
jgi:hypothetical protein